MVQKPQPESDAGTVIPDQTPKGISGSRRRERKLPRHRVLLIDDDPGVVDALATSLRNAGYDVDGVATGSQGLSIARERPPDLVVLGQELSDLDSAEVVIRFHSDGARVPILFVGERGSGPRRVGGPTVGGNSHIPKPFAIAEVVACVHRMIRRVDAGPEDSPVLRFADLTLDESTCAVTRDGCAISLTPQEFNLLRYFLLNPGRVHSKSQLIHNVWRYDFRGCDNVVPVCVGNLRRKLNAAGPPVIHTIRGKGYVLR